MDNNYIAKSQQYLFSWHVIGILNSLWFVIDIFNCLWSVNRQLTVDCDCIFLFSVNGDCLSENPVNCYLNITCDTWFRLLSVTYLGVAEIYIPRIAQNVPILMIFSQIFGEHAPIKIISFTRFHSPSVTPTSTSDAKECYMPDQLVVR